MNKYKVIKKRPGGPDVACVGELEKSTYGDTYAFHWFCGFHGCDYGEYL